jgi:hypothetical protein
MSTEILSSVAQWLVNFKDQVVLQYELAQVGREPEPFSLSQFAGEVAFCVSLVTGMTYLYTWAMQFGLAYRVFGAKNKIKSKKLCEAALYFFFYVFSVIWGLMVIQSEAWPLATRSFWIDYPLHEFSPFFKYYYIFQLSFYLHQSIVLVFLDGKRKDWVELGVHHAVTLTLITISYLLRHFRFGLVVLLIHDTSDVFLQLAKIFHYAELSAFTDITFAIFALVFFITRLVMLPIVVYSMWWEPQLYHPNLEPYTIQIYFGKGALLTLQVLHIIWFTMIMRMILVALRSNGVKGDIRSDSDEEPAKKTEKTKSEN